MSLPRLAALVAALAMLSCAPLAHAQLLLSTNDNKVTLVNGVATVVKSPPPDTLTVIDIKSWPPKVVAELDVPGSVVGPPFSVALAPDESIALVTANEKLDPVVAAVVMNGSNKPKDSPFYSDAGKLVLLRVSGNDLSRVGEAAIGHWSQGAAFSPDGKRIFVGNMVEKDIQVLSLDGTMLKDTGVRIAVKGGPAAIRIADR